MIKEKFLIIGPSWLGDMVMAQALFKTLLQINPSAIIDVVAPTWSLPVLQRMPEITNKIELAIPHGKLWLLQRYKLAKNLQQNNYTSAIILTNSWKSALIPWFAKIKKRTGWVGELRFGLINDIRYLDKKKYISMISRYIALAYPAHYNLPSLLLNQVIKPKLIIDPDNLILLKNKFNINNLSKLPILALCIDAAFGVAKCWPEEYYIKLAEHKIKQNWQVWIFGTKPNLSINNSSNLILNFSGKTSLIDTIDLLSLVDVVVCNDSGLMHIAASFNKKIIAIYGPTSSEFTPPIADCVKIVNKNLQCSPCFARTCPLGHHKCMKEITVELINNEIDKIYNL
jgi:heptosyltransferase II